MLQRLSGDGLLLGLDEGERLQLDCLLKSLNIFFLKFGPERYRRGLSFTLVDIHQVVPKPMVPEISPEMHHTQLVRMKLMNEATPSMTLSWKRSQAIIHVNPANRHGP